MTLRTGLLDVKDVMGILAIGSRRRLKAPTSRMLGWSSHKEGIAGSLDVR